MHNVSLAWHATKEQSSASIAKFDGQRHLNTHTHTHTTPFNSCFSHTLTNLGKRINNLSGTLSILNK